MTLETVTLEKTDDLWRVALSDQSGPISWRQVIGNWSKSEDFQAAFARILADAPFEAYFWETRPFIANTIDAPFEFALIDFPALSFLKTSHSAFDAVFAKCDSAALAASFPNLSHDAHLISPLPVTAADDFGHLAAFSRSAPMEVQQALWREVGQTIQRIIGDEPMWVSTNGMGVAWTHIRLDSYPKYYYHQPYCELP